MPPVVAAVVSVVAASAAVISAAVVAVGTVLAGTAAFLGISASTLLGIGLSVGLSLLNKRDDSPGSSLDFPTAATPSRATQLVRESIGSRRKVYGTMRLGGHLILQRSANAEVTGLNSTNKMYILVALCSHEIDSYVDYYLDDFKVTIDSNKIITSSDRSTNFSNKKIGKFDIKYGFNPQTVFEDLDNAFEDIDSTWQGAGVSLMLFIASAVTENPFQFFSNGINSRPSVVINGKKVLDPNNIQQGPTFSTNAARVILDHLIGDEFENGMRYPVDMINMERMAEVTNYCDAIVPGPFGTTRRRYELHGIVSYDERPIDALTRMLRSCNGQILFDSEGKLYLDVGEWKEPTVILTDDNIYSIEQDTGQFESEKSTVIKSTYLSPDHGYIEQEAAEYIHANASLYGRKIRQINFEMSANHSQTRHLQKIEANRLNANRRLKITSNLNALNLLGERYVRINSDMLGINSTFEIQNSPSELVDEEYRLFAIQFECVEIDESGVTYDELSEGASPPTIPSTDFNDSVPEVPTLSLLNSNGQVSANLTNISEHNSHYVRFREILSPTTFGPYSNAAFEARESQTAIMGLTDGANYEFQSRSVSSGGIASEFSSPIEFLFIQNTIPPADVVNTTLSNPQPGEILIGFSTQNDPSYFSVRVYGNTVDDPINATLIDERIVVPNATYSSTENGLSPGTYFRYLSSVNGSGTESARILIGSITLS